MTDDGARTPHDAPARVRAFYALPVEGEALEALKGTRDALARRAGRSRITVRFLADDALHVTLCFLGSVAADTLPEFRRVLEMAAAVSPLSARFAGLGAFSSPKRARVVVAELADSEGRVAALARDVCLGAEKLGIALERRAFRPHVTLARLKRPADVRDWLEHVAIEPRNVPFGEVRLYQSLLHPLGGRYSVLARAEFRENRA